MAVADDLIQWASEQRPWVADALRRLAQKGKLDGADHDDLLALVKQEFGIPCSLHVEARPLAASDIPDDEVHGEDVVLVSISGAKGLNALCDEQVLPFQPTGLTVVYGDNGSGKSGYTRVLKQACHVRGARETILPDVFADAPTDPVVVVNFRVGSQPASWTWSPGNDPAPELGRVALFDSGAANALVEQENEVVWKPRGLDLLDRLVPVVDSLQEALADEYALASTPEPLPAVADGTPAHDFLGRLDSMKDEQELEAFLVAAEDRARLHDLETSLGQGPGAAAAEAKRLRALALRVGPLLARIQGLEVGLGPESLKRAAAAGDEADRLREAARMASQLAFGTELVPGVGGDVWLKLWDAAQRFAESGGTPDGAFPTATSNATCVLCLQPLDDSAKGRLQRFRKFVTEDLSAQARGAADKVKAERDEILALVVHEGVDAPLLAEIAAEDAELGRRLEEFLDAAEVTRAAVASGHYVDGPAQVSAALAAWIDKLNANAVEQEKLDDPSQRAAKGLEKKVLTARIQLWDARDQVVREWKRRTLATNLSRACSALSTKGISRKSTELADKYVTEAAVKAYEAESKQIRVPSKVGLEPSGTKKGKSHHKVSLRLAPWTVGRRIGTTAVLSEGEKRAIALATFFAELRLIGGRSAIVIDDPVSSLDHERQDEVARRIVAEGLVRQVVVFTHNLVFLQFLKDIAEKEQRVPITIVEVARDETGRPGRTSGEAPWKAKGYNEQNKALNRLIDEFKRMVKIDALAFRRQLASAYGQLRQAAERAMEEKLLGCCVERFARGVHPLALWKVRDLVDDDVREFIALYDHATKWASIHDGTRAENAVSPTLQDFDDDVKKLRALVKRVEDRREHRVSA
ncbi:MAG: AAA family ATPase [Deltaproteobacteria bacterium]|nr:AAA family ATPase [Deltaproteobacteria bacterium]